MIQPEKVISTRKKEINVSKERKYLKRKREPKAKLNQEEREIEREIKGQWKYREK